jgi:hypothetical protein
MKLNAIIAGVAAAFTLGAALPAAAHDNDRGYGYDRRGRGEITIRMHHSQFSVDRGDRLFYRLTDRPYNFRPGYTYAYTDDCNRWGCRVLVFDRRGGRPIDRIFAPRPGYGADWRNGGRYVEQDHDRRYSDRRGDDRRW